MLPNNINNLQLIIQFTILIIIFILLIIIITILIIIFSNIIIIIKLVLVYRYFSTLHPCDLVNRILEWDIRPPCFVKTRNWQWKREKRRYTESIYVIAQLKWANHKLLRYYTNKD